MWIFSKKKKCPKCGYKIEKDWEFCPKCGCNCLTEKEKEEKEKKKKDFERRCLEAYVQSVINRGDDEFNREHGLLYKGPVTRTNIF